MMISVGNLLRRIPSRISSVRNVTQYKTGEKLGNWSVVKSVSVPELNLENAVHLEHSHCNAQWLHMENPSDETNAFSVHFKTVPQNSTGIPHILEHCTLCGSNQFPVRDPFMKMLNRSVATMNAMTGPDYTLYPFATPNSKDFYNLMQVYLDAVFNPLLREMDFHQEGWRLDFDKDKGDLAIKGVVFNEMKGAFADAQQVFGQKLLNSLLPSDTYGVCSGGLPEKIPDLTWEDLKQFHDVHYSPNNARFYSYGNLPLEQHLEAVQNYMPSSRSVDEKEVPNVPAEPRWSTPRREHIFCAEDPSGASNTFAMSYLVTPIEQTYESFVLRVLSELLVEGPSAPLYQALIESGLGQAFSPVTGYDTHTKDTAFTIGLQGISMEKADEIETIVLDTFERAAETGFEEDRIQAILNRTELSLKKQKNNFGWSLILNLTPGWNHVDDPLTLLSLNSILDRFREDIKDKQFLSRKIKEHFLNNNHRLTLTMSPKSDYLAQQQEQLDELEANLVSKLSEQERAQAIEQGKILEEMQSKKDSEEVLSCLPTLTLDDIPHSLPKYDGVSQISLGKITGQLSTQPTNEVAYVKFGLNTENVLTPTEKELLPLFTMIMTSMGAGSRSYREMDTAMELHTGGMGASIHMSENPNDATNLVRNQLLFSSVCLERKTSEMLSLWKDIFQGLLVPNEASFETTKEGLNTRLNDLITMSAVQSKNGLAHGGHHYAMAHAASKLKELPTCVQREKQSGISMVRLLNSIADDKAKISDLLTTLSSMSRKLLKGSNIMDFSISATPQKSDAIVKQFEEFITSLPSMDSMPESLNSFDMSVSPSDKHTYITAPFPVHFSSSVLRGTPSYTHPDAAPLRVLSRLLSSKYLHTEIREKGGAYGGGCAASPTSGVITFYSYRDPNFERTLDVFNSSNEWIQKGSFTNTDVDEAKLNVFKELDKPVLPGSRGMRLYLSGITDEQFEEHRRLLRNVTFADVQRVSEHYLGSSREMSFSTTMGPESTKCPSYVKVEPLF